MKALHQLGFFDLTKMRNTRSVRAWTRHCAARALLLTLAALELLLVVGCADTSIGSRRRIDWTEQVRLSSKELILVERWQENIRVVTERRSTGLFYAAGLKLKIPAGDREFAMWEGPLSPLALDTVAGRTYLVSTAPGLRNPALRQYDAQLSVSSYVAFELRGSEWVVIDLRDLPLEIKPNLLISTSRFFAGTEPIDRPFVTVERRIALNDYSNDPEFFKSIRRPPVRSSP
jgi:hypothetical protein